MMERMGTVSRCVTYSFPQFATRLVILVPVCKRLPFVVQYQGLEYLNNFGKDVR